MIDAPANDLGTPRFATNTGGTQVWAWAGDAFGFGAPSGAATVNIRMPGQYFDDESGNFYNWNRYYNPAIGRYISSDPIGIEGGLNTFLYAEASPVMYADPEGLYSVCMPGQSYEPQCSVQSPARGGAGAAIGLGAILSLSGDTPMDNESCPAIYHRLESPSQTPEIAALQQASGQIWGAGAFNSGIPAVKAYVGPLPEGARGIEFTTVVRPKNNTAPGLALWYAGSPGVSVNKEGYAVIPAIIIKNTQVQ